MIWEREVLPNNFSLDEQQQEDDSVVKGKPQKDEAEELDGRLRKDNRDDKLLHSKIDVDSDEIDKGRLLKDAINNNISSFCPDNSFEQLVKNYTNTKKMLGESMIRELTGYEPGYLDKNINIPEFKRELKEKIKQNIERLKKDGLLDKQGFITEQGQELAVLSMLSEEIDKLEGQGFLGENESKRKALVGDVKDFRVFRSSDKYKDLSVRQTLRKAMRRNHSVILKEDFVCSDKESKGALEVIYVLDSSGSMRGEKIGMAKKAGIALMYKAINNNDKAGLIIFGSKLSKAIVPSKDFYGLVKELALIRTAGETDIALGIESAVKLFSSGKNNKHIVLLTDAMQTLGKEPERKVLEQVSIASNMKISITVIGISLNEKGEKLAKKIVDTSQGSLFSVKLLDNLDQIVLEDYYRAKAKQF